MDIRKFLLTSSIALGLNTAGIALAEDDASNRPDMNPGRQSVTVDVNADQTLPAPGTTPEAGSDIPATTPESAAPPER
jgi:hypothetical protein